MIDDVMLTIRIPRSLRDEFHAMVKTQDITASQVLRGAIRQFVKAGRNVAIVNDDFVPAPNFTTSPQVHRSSVQEPEVVVLGPSEEAFSFSSLRDSLGMDDD